MCGPFHQLSVRRCSQLGTITKVKRKRMEFSSWKLFLYHSGLQIGKCLPSVNLLQGKAISYQCDKEDPSLFPFRMMKKDTQDYMWYIGLDWECGSALFISLVCSEPHAFWLPTAPSDTLLSDIYDVHSVAASSLSSGCFLFHSYTWVWILAPPVPSFEIWADSWTLMSSVFLSVKWGSIRILEICISFLLLLWQITTDLVTY